MLFQTSWNAGQKTTFTAQLTATTHVAASFIHSSWTVWPLKMVPTGCPETSVRNYHSTLHEDETERLSQNVGTELQFYAAWIWDRQVVPKRRYEITIRRCIKSQKSADAIFIAAEAWHLAQPHSSARGVASALSALQQSVCVCVNKAGSIRRTEHVGNAATCSTPDSSWLAESLFQLVCWKNRYRTDGRVKAATAGWDTDIYVTTVRVAWTSADVPVLN
jgi:hypothetical protein